ncbi:hypothetical protein [Weissella cibaria]|nr:hypothetical protein [Weissella cibaria]
MGELEGYVRIVVETDEKNPVVIAKITDKTVEVADGYRVRMKPTETD